MAATQEKETPFCHADESHVVGAKGGGAVSRPVRRKWASEPDREKRAEVPPIEVVASLIAPVEDIQETPSVPTSSKAGIPVMIRAQTRHPLDPLSAAEISVAVATVRAAGATPEVRDSMRFIEVVLSEPEKNIVALADAYYFPPFQPSLLPRTKGSPVIPSKLPPRRARLVVYNKKSNETSIWIVELSEVHAATRGGHHRGKVISSEVVPDVQPPMGLAGACRD